MDRFALDEGLLHSSVSQAFLLAVTLWLRKMTTDPHILTDVNIEYADDTYTNLKKKYFSILILYIYEYITVTNVTLYCIM